MNRSFALIAVTLASLTASPAQADLITWGTPQTVTTTTDVRTNGTLVTARNPWANTFAQPTVNGVPFIAFGPNGWTNGGWTLNAGSTTGDASYDELLDSARVTSDGSASNPNGWGAIQLDSLGALTVGNQYEIQVWYNDQRVGNGTNMLNDRLMRMSSVAGAATLSGGIIQNLGSLTQGTISAPLEADTNNVSGPQDSEIGQYVVGTFTRTSNDPLYLLVEGAHPVASLNLRPHINAFQIRDVSNGGAGTPFCDPANTNSTGGPAILTGALTNPGGSGLHLECTGGPSGEFGYFLIGTAPETVNPIAVGSGLLCLSAAAPNQIGRYNQTGTILNSVGQFDGSNVLQNVVGTSTVGSGYDVPTTLPFGGTIMAGESWHFQVWYRDTPTMAGDSNLSNGLTVTF